MMDTSKQMEFDALIIGGGIAGLQSALELADMGHKVGILDKDASVGGKMIRLSKVFPTLDCASCITTPKMAASAHHPNITLLTMHRLDLVEPDQGDFRIKATRMPRFVDPDKCIGCRKCEYACPSLVPDEEQGGFTARKAIHIPFSNAIPQIAKLDMESCLLCGKCEKVCPTDAVDYLEKPLPVSILAGAVILATGFELMTDFPKRAYGPAADQPNLISSLQMERLLAPHGPYMRVLRPSDGMEPDSIAFIQCAGSRDLQLGAPYCSRVCCMYAIKQAMLLSGALPLADLTIYYMDIRAFGKNYEQFFQNAQAMGIEFVKARPVVTARSENQGVVIRYEDQETGQVLSREHDLAVLSLAMVPGFTPRKEIALSPAEDGFIESVSPKLASSLTAMPGVFTAGAAAGPKDIVDSIVEAGSAAMQAAKHLAGRKNRKAAA